MLEKVKNTKLFEYHIVHLGIAMIIGAALGFWGENLGRLIFKGILDARFQRLPFIFCYGIAVVAIYLVLGTPNKPHFFGKPLIKKESRQKRLMCHLVFWTFSIVVVFFAEWLFGWIFELLTKQSLWDYSNIPLSIGKYASLPMAVAYGTAAYILMGFAFTPFMNLLERKCSLQVSCWIDLTLGTLLVIDFIVTCVLLCCGEAPMLWSIKVF